MSASSGNLVPIFYIIWTFLVIFIGQCTSLNTTDCTYNISSQYTPIDPVRPSRTDRLLSSPLVCQFCPMEEGDRSANDPSVNCIQYSPKSLYEIASRCHQTSCILTQETCLDLYAAGVLRSSCSEHYKNPKKKKRRRKRGRRAGRRHRRHIPVRVTERIHPISTHNGGANLSNLTVIKRETTQSQKTQPKKQDLNIRLWNALEC